MSEAERILEEYRKRRERAGGDNYAYTNPGNLFLRQGQERALLWALHEANVVPLGDRSILDVGFGEGRWSELLIELGADAEQMAGIELDEARAAVARHRLPWCDLRTGDASSLPWPDESFDIVTQATVFTSILDDRMRRQVAAEMTRVLRPGGVLLWYDFAFNNPRNRAVSGISAQTLRSLFSGARIKTRKVTLAPPLARRLASRVWHLAGLLEGIRVLNTHLVAVIRPRKRF
ncbi:MAG: class I SAM-dependent methyltransferase [Myxococcota bacterium]